MTKSSRMRLIAVALCNIWLAFGLAFHAFGQITGVGDDQTTPLPGGHDYIQGLSETVTPSNGQVSIRINVPLPAARHLNIPFYIAYDSSGFYHLTPTPGPCYFGRSTVTGIGFWGNNGPVVTGPFSTGGWAYTVPQFSWTQGLLFDSPFANCAGPYSAVCQYTSDYIFYDPSGGRHSLGLDWKAAGSSCDWNAPVNRASGGDEMYLADLYSSLTPVVSDFNGTVFKYGVGGGSINGTQYILAAPEDRNGNQMAITDTGGGVSYLDTAGRTALSASGFGNDGDTLTVAGDAQPYTIHWQNVAFGFPAPDYTLVFYTNNTNARCGFPSGSNDATTPMISSIVFPNGDTYSFTYGGFGLLSKIVYPSGGSVSYTWGWNHRAESALYNDDQGDGSDSCEIDYDTPALVERDVYDGSTLALKQTFQYVTNWDNAPRHRQWTTKQTIVTDTDYVSGAPSTTTTYTYGPQAVFSDPDDVATYAQAIAAYLPIETSVQYGSLETVTKLWAGFTLLACEAHTTGSASSGTRYKYSGNAPYLGPTEKQEFDFGSGAYNCPNSSGWPASPTRDTQITYQSFPATPAYPYRPSLGRFPASVSVTGTGGNSSLTTYTYDSPNSLVGTPGAAAQHDDTNYGSGFAGPRGNVTSVQRKVNSTTNVTTSHTYDDTGNTT